MWFEYSIIKHSFRKKADEAPVEVVPPFECVDADDYEDKVFIYVTLFENHPNKERTIIDPTSTNRVKCRGVSSFSS